MAPGAWLLLRRRYFPGKALSSVPTDVARLVPVWPDGIDAFDLQEGLKKEGWESLVFTGSAESAARLVEAGFGVVSMVREKRGKHAVSVVGSRRSMGSHGRCSETLEALYIFNPRQNRSVWLNTAEFESKQFAKQHLVFFPPGKRAQLSTSGFPLQAAEKVDRRFRASALLRRAKKHGEINKQSLRLAERAVAADPQWDEAIKLLKHFRQFLSHP